MEPRPKRPCVSDTTARECPFSKTPCLDEEECPFSLILENVRVGVILSDTLRAKLIYQNAFATDLLTTTTGARDDTASSLLSPDRGLWLDVSDGGAPRTLHCGGRLLELTPYRLNARYCFVFIRDVTDQRRLESAVEAVDVSEAASFICTAVRHDLASPVNSMKLSLSVLRESLGHDSMDKMREYVDRSLSELFRMEYLLRSLESFSIFERREPRDVDLRCLLQQLLLLVGEDIKAKGIALRMRPSSEPHPVRADPRALLQVKLNIISNSVEAVGDRENPEIIIAVSKRDGCHQISVSDNGCGISAEEQKHLFKPFYTSKPKGNGLGLAIARKTLAAMDGSIEVQSEENVGTTVTLRLGSRLENA